MSHFFELLPTVVCAVLVLMLAVPGTVEGAEKISPALDFTLKSLNGKQVDLREYEGKVVMIVNVASECGLTPQYKQLQVLHAKYAARGLAILGFPCNQFGGQEPGSASEILKFCKANYGVEFDMFSKIEVNGDSATDLYKYLKSVQTTPKGSGEISWNFEKFILDRSGQVVARFEPRTSPDDPSIIRLLESKLSEQ